MKKLFGYIAVLCTAVLVLLAFAGCNGDKNKNGIDATGNWKIDLNQDGLSYNQTQVYKPIVEALNGKVEIKSDGKLTISAEMGGESKQGDGTWTLEGEKLSINDPIGALGKVGTVTFTYKDGKFLSDSQQYVCLTKS